MIQNQRHRHAEKTRRSFRRREVYEPIAVAEARQQFLTAARYNPAIAKSLLVRGRVGTEVRRVSLEVRDWTQLDVLRATLRRLALTLRAFGTTSHDI